MSHRKNFTGRPFVECDEPIRDESGVAVANQTGGVTPGGVTPGRVTLCLRRSFGAGEHRRDHGQLDIFDLPRGWSVAPYPDDYDHGATRTSLLDGMPIPPLPHLVGIQGDLHTCPRCRR